MQEGRPRNAWHLLTDGNSWGVTSRITLIAIDRAVCLGRGWIMINLHAQGQEREGSTDYGPSPRAVSSGREDRQEPEQ